MGAEPGNSRPKPVRVGGWRHILAAGLYSLGGLRRLWRETAFRHEMLFGAVILCALFAIGAGPEKIVISAILVFLLIAVEALNTALEVIVDHISPDWSAFARDAKDLGSLAVLCLLLANGLFLIFSVWSVCSLPVSPEKLTQMDGGHIIIRQQGEHP